LNSQGNIQQKSNAGSITVLDLKLLQNKINENSLIPAQKQI
jgi:hypothetical protein